MSDFALSSIQIEHIQALFHSADSVIFSAGAGMGVDSGLPDFRGNKGMWQAYPELGRQKLNFSSIANPQAFKRDAHLAWGFYGHRLDLYRKTQPHKGFNLLKTLADHLQLPYFVFTSNVDGHFQKAGFEDDLIYECHGSIHHLQCASPCSNDIWQAKALEPNIDEILCRWQNDLPSCRNCGRLARPNILMFDDYHWSSERQKQQQNRLKKWLEQYDRTVVLEMGAGTAIPTVRYFSEQFAPRLIRINPREYQIPKEGGLALATTAQQGVQQIYRHLVHLS